jgi:hypothetical protein
MKTERTAAIFFVSMDTYSSRNICNTLLLLTLYLHCRPRKGRKGSVKYEQVQILTTPPLAPEGGLVKWNHIFQVLIAPDVYT